MLNSKPSLCCLFGLMCRDTDNVMFAISVDNTVTVWAPINSWEPHILYQRASISMGSAQPDKYEPSIPQLSTFCIFVDSTELTRALETVFNRMNGIDVHDSDQLAKIAEIARKGPEICLMLNQVNNSICVWGIDVRIFQYNLDSQLIGTANRLYECEAFKHFQDTRPSFATWLAK